MISKVDYHAFPNCVQIANGDCRIIVSTDVGPRILFYGFDEGKNVLGWHPDAAVTTQLGEWKPYGGHRLWVAPENMPLSYVPDNDVIEYTEDDSRQATFKPALEKATAIQKQITISLEATGTHATISHRITNTSERDITISAWALTIMQPGGVVTIPNEPFAPYSSEHLLPVRSLAQWSYTDFTDPRWSFDRDAIRLKVDENVRGQQKLGVMNRLGWASYEWSELVFTKRIQFIDGAVYPDMNSNFEVYTDGGFVEIETLSPLRSLAPGEQVEHTEHWELTRAASRT